MDNYNTIRGRVASLRTFKGNSSRGIYDGATYVIYSYSTPIAWHDGTTGRVTETKYSQTTSRLQNIIRNAWGVK